MAHSPRIARRSLFGFAAAPWLLRGADPPKKIAALVSEYRPGSHADAILGKILNGFYYEGKPREARLRIVSMYTDQVPDEDMSRDLAAKHGFRLVPSIRHALTLTSDTSTGPRTLAVDGILLICEHGAYPYNPLGQKLYPRYEFFKQVIDVFRETGSVAPVFSDKHLSYEWARAKWMYDQARQLQVPLMAGSVEPISRDPNARLAPGTALDKVVTTWQADFFDSKDSYGFHALESMQSIVERRMGRETGVAAVQCFEHGAVWDWIASNAWAGKLLAAALGSQDLDMAGLRERTRNPIAFVLDYVSGLQAAVFRLNGVVRRPAFAAFLAGKTEPFVLTNYASTDPAVQVPSELRSRYPYNHFSATVARFEDLVWNGRTPNPVERTLLTTGVLAALFESSYQPAPNYGRSLQHGMLLDRGRHIETPHLRIAYQPT
jgi:hypothetical protein